ncbi:MAG: hypothetical protein ACOCY1_03065 [Halovenus sp.]
MPITQIRSHGDRNVVPDHPDASTGSQECPIDEFTLSHMRATSTDE